MYQFQGCIDRMREALDLDDDDTDKREFHIPQERLHALWSQADRELGNVYWAGQEERDDRSPNNTRALALEIFKTLWAALPAHELTLAVGTMETAINMAIQMRKKIPHEPDEC